MQRWEAPDESEQCETVNSIEKWSQIKTLPNSTILPHMTLPSGNIKDWEVNSTTDNLF